MNRQATAFWMMRPEDLSAAVESHLREHPEIAKALQLFEMSLEEYRKALVEPDTFTSSNSNILE